MNGIHPIFEPILAKCRVCGFVGGTHAANCRTQLATPEQRVRRAAHLFDCFYAWRAGELARKDGLSESEIASGAKLARVRREQRSLIYSQYGSPEYGSYTIAQKDRERGEQAEQAVIDAHLAAERKPAIFEQLPLDEQLVASIAVAAYRKGRA